MSSKATPEEPKDSPKAAPKYKVLVGVNYPPKNRRAEPGDVVDDIPEYRIKSWLRDGVIEESK